jgi:hypothetical protein
MAQHQIRFYDLRASHLTMMLDKGEPVHVVAVAETNASVSKEMV